MDDLAHPVDSVADSRSEEAAVTEPSDAPMSRAELDRRLADLRATLLRMAQLHAQREDILRPHEGRYQPSAKKWRGAMYWLWVAILTGALLLIAFAIVFRAYYAESLGTAGPPNPGLPLLMLAPFPVALVLAGAVVAVHDARLPRVNRKRQSSNDEIRSEIESDVAAETEPIDAELRQIGLSIEPSMTGWFPRSYCYEDAVGFCLGVVRDHRAATVEQALNLYETTRHQQRLENLASAQLAEQRRVAHLTMVGNVINAAGHAATIAAVNQPRTIHVRHY
ncbi:MAG: hypothetical protein ACK5KO_04085 [Arachnia sp.]